jgi:hypothetical protein
LRGTSSPAKGCALGVGEPDLETGSPLGLDLHDDLDGFVAVLQLGEASVLEADIPALGIGDHIGRDVRRTIRDVASGRADQRLRRWRCDVGGVGLLARAKDESEEDQAQHHS